MRHSIANASIPVIFFACAAGWLSAQSNSPATTRPAETRPQTILVLPFVAPADSKQGTLGTDLQQDIASAIGPNLRGRVDAPTSTQPASDVAAALEAGRTAHAAAVIFGRAQVNGDQVRVTGEVVDVAKGKPLGNLKVTGSADQLFQLEDKLDSDVLASMPAELLNLRGLVAVRQSALPRIIYLPAEPSITSSVPQNAPIDGGYAGPIPPRAPLVPPGGWAPYSPYAGSYPSRFYAPYGHLFGGGDDFNPFLPPYVGVWGSAPIVGRDGNRAAPATGSMRAERARR